MLAAALDVPGVAGHLPGVGVEVEVNHLQLAHLTGLHPGLGGEAVEQRPLVPGEARPHRPPAVARNRWPICGGQVPAHLAVDVGVVDALQVGHGTAGERRLLASQAQKLLNSRT